MSLKHLLLVAIGIAYNIQDPEEEWRIFRKLANQAAVTSTLPVSGGAAAVENSLYSRFRVLTGVAMAEAAMARKYPYVQAALSAMEVTSAVLGLGLGRHMIFATTHCF